MAAPQPRPEALAITPYVGGESQLPMVNRVIKLASNEGALGPSPAAVAAVREGAAALHRYPDGASTALRRELARTHGLNGDHVVCGAGSDELITLLSRAYAGPGEEVLYTRHGFLMYPIAARAAGALPIAVAERNLRADVDALLAAVTEATRILFLANPNNPTGTYLTVDELDRLRRGLPEGVLLVIDAAYAEYAEADDYAPGHHLVEAGANVVVTRTFSKIYGLGGLRLGWAHCPPAVADVLNRIRNPFNVSSLAQAAGIAALSDRAFLADSVRHNREWRAWTTDRLRALGLEVPESFANFVLVRFSADPARTAAAADAFLRTRGIIARRMDSYGLADRLRITIGRGDEMAAVADALADFVA